MTTIDDLVERLLKIKAEHGNLRCVTPGFDESNYEDVKTIDTKRVLINHFRRKLIEYGGNHVLAKETDSHAEVVVEINF